MKVSFRWLGRHVDLTGISPEEVARDLTLHTAEVEGLEPFAPALSEVVVGHVVEHGRHPDADKLSLCRVDLGAAGPGELVPIVCGAPNVGAGQKVAVARVGCRLPGEVKVKKTKIRGQVSLGMICSQRELELGEDHTGIWVLPEEAQVGLPVAAALGIEDRVLEIDNKSLTHRPDLWGHRGIASEIAAIRGLELLPLDLDPLETGAGEPYPVRVESEGCSRYLGLAIDGVRIEESPDWLKLLLLAAGQRPLDLLVDVSNFAMMDLGQPNHLFDRRRLSADGILVRDARAGERVTSLDGLERRMGPEDVLICSGEEAVAIAGVMGGEGSKVDPGTSELLLEVACFHPTRVRRTAARLGLRTEASARFEKHLDPTLPARAAAHLVRILRGIQPGIELPRPMGDAGRWSDPARELELRPDRVRKVLGTPIEDAEIRSCLDRLGLAVTDGEPWRVAIPSARATKDLTIEEDLIEEVGRLVGYDRIEERALVGEVIPPPRDERRLLVRRIQDRLSGGARFHEVLTYSFLPDGLAARFSLREEPHVEATNPVQEGWQRIRRGVMPSLLARVDDNLRHREEVRLFDLGKGYLPELAGERGEPAEVHELALVWAGAPPGRKAPFDSGSLSRLRGAVEDLLEHLERPVTRWERAADHGQLPVWAHPGRALVALAGDEDPQPAALVADLEPGLARELGAEVAGADAAAALISIDRLLELPTSPSPYRALPRYPGVKVDVALAVPGGLSATEARGAIEQAGKGLVEDAELFDVYAGASVGPGRKSLAWHVLLQSGRRTLTDKDCHKFLDRLERLTTDLGGELRRQ